jgi:hypothetical protein
MKSLKQNNEQIIIQGIDVHSFLFRRLALEAVFPLDIG